MKLLTCQYDGLERIAVLTASGTHVIPLSSIVDIPEDMTMTAFIAAHTEEMLEGIRRAAEDFVQEAGAPGTDDPAGSAIPLNDVRLCAPITRPIHDILCVGVNYASHVEETRRFLRDARFQRPESSIYFGKRAIRIAGPEEQVCFREDLDPEMETVGEKFLLQV